MGHLTGARGTQLGSTRRRYGTLAALLFVAALVVVPAVAFVASVLSTETPVVRAVITGLLVAGPIVVLVVTGRAGYSGVGFVSGVSPPMAIAMGLVVFSLATGSASDLVWWFVPAIVLGLGAVAGTWAYLVGAVGRRLADGHGG